MGLRSAVQHIQKRMQGGGLLHVALLVVVFVAEARYFNDDAISYGLNGNEAALRRSPPRGDLKLMQLPASTDLPQLPQSLPPLRRADQIPTTTNVALEMLQLPSRALPQQLPSLETSQVLICVVLLTLTFNRRQA